MRWRAEAEPVDVAGLRGWYTVAGAGPPVVLLATPFALGRTYKEPVEALARAHRVFTVELPGSGRGSKVPAGWGIGDYAGWAAGFLDAVGLARVTLVGHSYSAAVAVVAAADAPRRIDRLVVADGVGAGPDRLWRVLAGRAADAALEAGLVARRWPHLAANLLTHPRNFARLTRAAIDADVTAHAARVRVPALVAWGRRDHTTPAWRADVFARHLPDPTVYVSPHGSHDWLITSPGEFAAVVGAFTGAVPGVPALAAP